MMPARRTASLDRRAYIPLLAVIAIAGLVLRLVRPGAYPPGLNQDEAINAWNAWCLLRTGQDMTGAHWPVFYSHAVGDQRSTLFFYLLLPFQAIFGLSAWSTRLPAALLGAACVPLIAIVGRRLFGDRGALVAAVLIAFDPWHVFLSRIGIEGGVTPFLGLLPLALLAGARLLAPESDETPNAGWALAAGVSAGIGAYGYWSVRAWLPGTLVLLALAAGPVAWRRLREPAFGRPVLALGIGLALTLGPLAWKHLTDPTIGHRAEMTRLWSPGASPIEIAGLVASRWAMHFGPAFLFLRGDSYDLLQPPMGGALPWFVAVLLVAGLVAAFTALRSPAARTVIALVVAWPLGDVLASYVGVHSLRSAVGLPALLLLAAYGAERLLAFGASRGTWGGRAAWAALLSIVVVSDGRALATAFGEYNGRAGIWHGYQSDLLQAGEWLRPRLKPNDTVVCTITGFNEPWSVLLVALRLDPREWFAAPKERRAVNGWDVYPRIGRWWFLYDPADVQRRVLSKPDAGTPRRVWLIVRPNEIHEAPLLRVVDPQGRESLWVAEVTL